MEHEFILTNETNSLKCSLYKTPEGKLKIWLKVHAALLEIPEEEFDDLVEIFLETLHDIEEMKGITNDEVL